MAARELLRGRVVEAPSDLPGSAGTARIADPQGSGLTLFKSATGDAADALAMAGRFFWNELHSSDRPRRFRRLHEGSQHCRLRARRRGGPSKELPRDGVIAFARPILEHGSTGRRIEYAGAAFFQVRDGRVTDGLVLGDTAALHALTGPG
jgi:hypothetical protein